MNAISRLASLLAVPTLLPLSAWAIEPESIDFLGFQFIPTLSLGERYDDNFRELENNDDASWVTTIAPSFELLAEDRNSAYRLTYQGNSEVYHDASDASNTDHTLKLESILEFSSRQRLKLEAGYRQIEETSSTAVAGENDKYHSTSLGGVYSFGNEQALNRLDLGASYEELRYDNSDGINADEERDTSAFSATWLHRLGGSTHALLEARHTDYDYLTPASPRNSTNDALLLGATWDATARTTGKLRVGYEKKDFDDSSRDDLDSPMWEVGIDWKPRTYSTFSLTTRQAFDEGDDGSDAIKTTSTQLSWGHGWTERVTSNLSFGLTRQDYEGQAREDEITTAGLALTYKMRRWLDIEVGYRYRDNDSSAANESFQRNVYLISLTGSL